MNVRPFTYNPDGNILGTQQIGSLSIGTPTDGFESALLKWWNGPDEDLGYVIAKPDLEGLHRGADGDIAYLGFWRTNGKTDAAFIELGNYLLQYNLATTAEVKAALETANYWTSYGEAAPSGNDGTSGNSGSGLGEWSFYSDEGPINAEPPTGNGQLIITGNTDNGTVETYDPNYDPNDASVFSKMIALNLSNSAGVSRETEFTELMNNGGTISLTQNGQTATYSFNSGGPFFVDPNGWFVIPVGIQTTSTDGPFVFGDPITVSIP